MKQRHSGVVATQEPTAVPDKNILAEKEVSLFRVRPNKRQKNRKGKKYLIKQWRWWCWRIICLVFENNKFEPTQGASKLFRFSGSPSVSRCRGSVAVTRKEVLTKLIIRVIAHFKSVRNAFPVNSTEGEAREWAVFTIFYTLWTNFLIIVRGWNKLKLHRSKQKLHTHET